MEWDVRGVADRYTGPLAHLAGRARMSPNVTVATVLALILAVTYLRWLPQSPDLAAQVARADVTRQVGSSSWWTGWFGGLSMPSYSVIVPSSMAALGVRTTGVLATVAGAVGTARLLGGAVRPRAGACAFALSGFADLLIGRITFVVGAALAVWALDALRSRWDVPVVALAVGSYLASPLAGLFLGLIFVSVAIVDSDRRRISITGAATVLALAITMALLFPGTGTMPFDLSGAAVPAVCCAAVFVICRQRLVRLVAAFAGLATLGFVLYPGAVGSNITRLAWIAAAPIAVAYATIPRRYLVPVVALLAAWPLGDTVSQLHAARSASASAAFYQPLAAELDTQRAAAGANTIGQRVEVVDTTNHWASVYLPGQSLARGWDRQADYANNPIFYAHGALTSASYRQWLSDLAVGWVAVPTATLDFASVAEGRLVRAGPIYLHLVWSTRDWKLYRVTPSSPLVTGAVVEAVTSNSVVISTSGPATVDLRLRWSPYLRTVDPITRQDVASCVSNDNGWLSVYLPAAVTVAVSSDFTVANRLRPQDPDCREDLTTGTP